MPHCTSRKRPDIWVMHMWGVNRLTQGVKPSWDISLNYRKCKQFCIILNGTNPVNISQILPIRRWDSSGAYCPASLALLPPTSASLATQRHDEVQGEKGSFWQKGYNQRNGPRVAQAWTCTKRTNLYFDKELYNAPWLWRRDSVWEESRKEKEKVSYKHEKKICQWKRCKKRRIPSCWGVQHNLPCRRWGGKNV